MKLSIRKLLKKKLKSKIDAFTLVEMLIVLALLGMILLITIKPAANMVQRYQEKIFWQNLQHAWNKELSTLAQRKENGKVLFNDQ
ncbi:MAG: type II secretion system protein [Liquorilactobacillus ghanensis]